MSNEFDRLISKFDEVNKRLDKISRDVDKIQEFVILSFMTKMIVILIFAAFVAYH